MKNKTKKKWWVKLIIIAGSVLAFVGVVLLGAIGYFRFSVGDYYSASEEAFEIPGLSDDFVPQGMHYDENIQTFVITGYQSDGSASPVYFVEKDDDETDKFVYLLEKDGKPFTGHAGGIAVYGNYAYVAGGADRCVYVFDYAEMKNAVSGTGVKCIGTFDLFTTGEDYMDVSFVTVEGSYLIVGEFYDGGKYLTPDSHKFHTKGGDYNQALALTYALDASQPFGINPTPLSAYSLPNKVQGMCFADGKMYLSTSYGLAFSHIYEYDCMNFNDEGDITILGHTVKMYSVDSASLVYDYKIAPMSEEIVMLDGKLYVMCESASNKYIFGKFIGGKWCYKTDLSEMRY